jgi:hypothetical protein
MSSIEEQKDALTGPHSGGGETAKENWQDDEDVKELNKAINIAEDLVSWSRTPSGKDTVLRLQREARKAMNDLFTVLHEYPELGRLIASVARFEASVQMMRRFTGAEEDLDMLLKELSRKNSDYSI